MTQTAITDIGAALKTARESKDISVSSAAMQTNLSPRIIDKLEKNQFAEIGAPVFTRGYLTQYARFLGLDAAAFTAAFNRLNPEETPIRLSSANKASQSRSYRRRSFGAWLITIPLLILAGAVVLQVMNPNSWLMTQFKQAFIEEHAEQAAEAPARDIPLQVGSAESSQPADGQASAAPAAPPATLPTLTSLEDTAEGETSEQAPVLETAGDSQTPADAPAAAGSANSLALTNENWVEVRNKDKKIIASKLYKKGESIELPADGAPYDITIGRPEDAVLTLAGKTAQLPDFRVKNNTRKFRVTMEQGQAGQ